MTQDERFAASDQWSIHAPVASVLFCTNHCMLITILR